MPQGTKPKMSCIDILSDTTSSRYGDALTFSATHGASVRICTVYALPSRLRPCLHSRSGQNGVRFPIWNLNEVGFIGRGRARDTLAQRQGGPAGIALNPAWLRARRGPRPRVPAGTFDLILKASAWPVAGRGPPAAKRGPDRRPATRRGRKAALKMYRKFSQALVRTPKAAALGALALKSSASSRTTGTGVNEGHPRCIEAGQGCSEISSASTVAALCCCTATALAPPSGLHRRVHDSPAETRHSA